MYNYDVILVLYEIEEVAKQRTKDLGCDHSFIHSLQPVSQKYTTVLKIKNTLYVTQKHMYVSDTTLYLFVRRCGND